MSVATPINLPPIAPPPGSRATARELVIATINRPRGDTGVHTHTRTLAEGIAHAGFPCTVCSPFHAGPMWLPVFAVRPLLLRPVNKTWSTLWHRRWHGAALRVELIRQLRRRDRDVAVVAQCPVSAHAAMEARQKLGGRFPITMVCHFNHSEAREYRQKGELAGESPYQRMLDFEKAVIESVERVIYVSHFARQVVEQERGLRPRESAVIWNGIAAEVKPVGITRRDLGLKPDDLVLMNVGTLEPRKNQLGLVEQFFRIAPEHPQARLVLVGEGPARKLIEQRVAELGLQDRVRLLGLRHDVPALLPLADVYMHYATIENCPMVLLEAARAALPIAALPAGGVAELLAELAGVPLDPGDVAQSLGAIRPLLEQVHVRQELGRRARSSFARLFTDQAMVAQYLRALDLKPRGTGL